MGNQICQCKPALCESQPISECSCHVHNDDKKTNVNTLDFKSYRDEYVETLVSGYIRITICIPIAIPDVISVLCSQFYFRPSAKLFLWKEIKNDDDDQCVTEQFQIYDDAKQLLSILPLKDVKYTAETTRCHTQHMIRNTHKIPQCFDAFNIDITKNAEYNLVFVMHGTNYYEKADAGDIIIFNHDEAYHIGFECAATKDRERYSKSDNMLIHDDQNHIIAVLRDSVLQFNMNTLEQSEMGKKLLFTHRDAAIAFIPDCNSMLLVGGSMDWQNPINVKYLKNDRLTKVKECKHESNHESIDLVEIYSLDGKARGSHPDGLVSAMNYNRAKTGCVYNEWNKNIIVGGGEHFVNKNVIDATVKHYNHTFETYDVNKNHWSILPHQLNFNYTDFPSLWIDHWNSNIVYIMNNDNMDSVEFIDVRENRKLCYCLRRDGIYKNMKINDSILFKASFQL